MLARWEFWVTTLVALLTAVIAGYTMMLLGQNRIMQAELAGRTLYIQQSVQLEPLYRDLLKSLADLSVANGDKALSDLLATQGIKVTASASPSQPLTDSASDAKP